MKRKCYLFCLLSCLFCQSCRRGACRRYKQGGCPQCIYSGRSIRSKDPGKSYTADELAALKETKVEGYGYLFYKGDSCLRRR
jgi:hypothetical protein